MPTEYIPSVEQGFRDGCVKGAKYGFPCVDIQATLLDGKYHDVDSSAGHVQAGGDGVLPRRPGSRPGITLLEPIMNVVVHAPGQYQGDLAGDINRRRGEILNFSLGQGPLHAARLHPAGGAVRLHQRPAQLHQRHGVVQMEPSHYAPVKEELADLRRPEQKGSLETKCRERLGRPRHFFFTDGEKGCRLAPPWGGL